MNSKSFCSPEVQPQHSELRAAGLRSLTVAALVVLLMASCMATLAAGGTPGWMQALVNAPLPAHDEKTDAVLLYSEDVLTVQADGQIKDLIRRAYKILRPAGSDYGVVVSTFDPETRITSLRGWCIPAQGKDYEVKEKDAVESSLSGVQFSELISDVRMKAFRIPAADPGNIVGYEIERELRLYVLQDDWAFQWEVPVREAWYTLQLPPGWEYKVVWLHHPEVAPAPLGGNQWRWQLTDIPAIRPQAAMPPWESAAGKAIVSLFPPKEGQNKGFSNWREMGTWYLTLTNGRRDASPAIKDEVAKITASAPSVLGKMQALANFLQRDVRYVAIKLGIGGWQPHTASDVFTHRYGDCKDKATLLSSMLHEIGIESYYVVVNANRGAVTADAPPYIGEFNHVILAIRLPDSVNDPSLMAVKQHAKLGRLLFFDPTDYLTPFGQIRGELQSNYGLLVTPDGGELIELPQLAPAMNGVERTARLSLSSGGTLTGDVQEVRLGASAESQRNALRNATTDADKIKPIETLLAHSLGAFYLTKASVGNFAQIDRPFVYNYSFVAEGYAKTAGDLLLVRPRVIGVESSDLLETKEPRQYPIVFESPRRDSNTYEIVLPAGYEVDDLPPPADADYSFASYHSKTEVKGNVLRYTRAFELKELVVSLKQADELKKFYRLIASDERNTAVLRPAGAH